MVSYIKRKSRKQEQRTAKEFSGRTQIASGAIDGLKGDVRTGTTSIGFNEKDFLIENKFTDAQKYKLELKIWHKIAKEALRDNFRIPLLQVDIYDMVSLVILDFNDFISMGGCNYFTSVSMTTLVPKAKSIQLDACKYSSYFQVDPYFLQRITFKVDGTELAVMDKNEFIRFLDSK